MVQEWMLWALVLALLGIFVALFTLAGREDIRRARERKAREAEDVWVRHAASTAGTYEAWLDAQTFPYAVLGKAEYGGLDTHIEWHADTQTWPYEPPAGYDVDERKEGA